ncbi:MAG: glycosyltransferase family 10 [Oscillatoria sp. PMC 1051.18]|nr:glycosyltransferase family 10 [Oscillatoria sp. PMC 1050.18]MEC5030574.1 glycosyltransferase family 10 [Oscillatoria sp. PMC 1051.18]
MSKKIVGMMTTYKGVEQSDWLWKQTPQPFGVWGNMQMLANSEKPDFLLLYQYDFHRRKKPQGSLLSRLKEKVTQTEPEIPSLLQEIPKERIIYLLREPPLPEVIPTNKLNYDRATDYCGYVSGPDEFAPQPDYMPAIWYVGNSFRELNDMEPPAKEKLCSWITSGISRTTNHRQRLAFLRMLRESNLDFDVYGRDLPDWAKGYGTVSNKWHAMAPYYYNLAIENYADNDLYVSEKLWDALLCWCLPIYYGGSAADKLLPPGSFLRLPSQDEKGLAYIKEVTANPDAWYEAKDAIAEARQIILHKLNLLAWLADFVEKH